ncbi:MAG TPA: M20/M25/M40 family metallo-hydrolase, partial [Vicinamibacterales bacterium]|nr:M20/M25/M40 family metallo-hydrolase [Vicinamibacterales bacterium]
LEVDVLRSVVGGGLALALAVGVVQAQSGAATPADLLKDPAVKSAIDGVKATEAQTIADQIRFCEIPAPEFKEEVRGQELKRVFTQLGLQNVRVDKVGNVLGDYPGAAAHPHLVLAAHLDTVFPEGTDVKVKREGSILKGPGIGDDCRGLAVMVAIVREMKKANVKTPGSITFVANVGEEGLGDLRGVKELFKTTLKDQIDRFVSIDGTGVHVTNVAVGSHRYRITFKGPGGHSFGAFGLANPMGAMGRAIAKIQELQVPKQPRTTFNVGRIGGGTSVNSIPFEGWMELDMRSSDPASLAAIDASIQKAIDAAVVEENARWGKPGVITVVKELVGDRPAGSTPENSPIVRNGLAAATVLGFTSNLGEGSTDSNTPMALGVPAITIGGGGRGRDAHALTENFDTTDAWQGAQHALLLTIALAQK